MRAFMAILFLTLAAPGLAQAPSSNSIWIGETTDGVLLSPGAAKDSVLRTLRGASFYLKDGETSEPLLLVKRDPTRVYGTISFRAGRLSSITKYWWVTEPDQVAIVKAIYGAISSFGESGQSCNVSTFDDQQPTTEKKGVVVSCGRRQVHFFTSRWKESPKSESREDVVISEILSNQL
jgi:hypothetical protein